MARDEPKQIIIVRKDLNMRKGKIAAQSAHASLKAILDLGINTGDSIKIPLDEPAVRQWLEQRFTKICVYVNSEDELVDLYNKADDIGLPCSLIIDAGLTEFNGVPTKTVVAIGPAYPEEIDPITKHLPLL